MMHLLTINNLWPQFLWHCPQGYCCLSNISWIYTSIQFTVSYFSEWAAEWDNSLPVTCMLDFGLRKKTSSLICFVALEKTGALCSNVHIWYKHACTSFLYHTGLESYETSLAASLVSEGSLDFLQASLPRCHLKGDICETLPSWRRTHQASD